jgi:hypothetical protein
MQRDLEETTPEKAPSWGCCHASVPIAISSTMEICHASMALYMAKP